MATNWIRAFREGTGSQFTPVSLTFAHSRTAHIDEFERYFGCPVRFGRQTNCLQIQLSDLDRKIVTADDRLLALLRQYCQDILSKQPEQQPLLVEKVERVIADQLANGQAKLDVVASEVGMSSRSLSRRLSELGTSFNDLIEGLRKQIAHRYLHETDMSCTQIAFVLGYSDVSSFNHAFKRWSGETPTAARKSLAA
jgi:AraC-like DNA-binding protein